METFLKSESLPAPGTFLPKDKLLSLQVKALIFAHAPHARTALSVIPQSVCQTLWDRFLTLSHMDPPSSSWLSRESHALAVLPPPLSCAYVKCPHPP